MNSPRGFTLLEVLVATLILGVAVAGLLFNINTSMRNAARLADYDRTTFLAKRQMDELLHDPLLPRSTVLTGEIDPRLAGGAKAGWRAQLDLFEAPPGAQNGARVLDQLRLEVWWGEEENRRTLELDSYRPGILGPPGAPANPLAQ
jgi:general secretion pathway protein I